MTPIPDRPALSGCTVAGTMEIPGGGTVSDLTGADYRAVPVEGLSGPIGDLLTPPVVPTVVWDIEFLSVLPKETGHLSHVFETSALERSVSAMQNWFLSQTGSRLRIRPEIGRVRLNETSDQIAATGERVRDRIETLLRDMGLIHAFTLYAVWYNGVSHDSCGGGAWPHGEAPPPNVQTPGRVAALYLRGAFGNVVCARDAFSSDGVTPAINEFKMLHEILHTMGIVSPAAPHHVDRGHVSHDEHDLMYSGPRIWRPSVIDAGHQDYFQTGRTDVNDLSRSEFLDPRPPNAQPPAGWDAPFVPV